MLAGGGSNVRRSMPKSDSARGKAEFMSRSCSRSLSSGDHRWTESGRKTTTIPANPASVTATCAAMPRASLGCIATIKGEHGQEIKAQIHARARPGAAERSKPSAEPVETARIKSPQHESVMHHKPLMMRHTSMWSQVNLSNLRLRGGHGLPALNAARLASRIATICLACERVSSRRLATPPRRPIFARY